MPRPSEIVNEAPAVFKIVIALAIFVFVVVALASRTGQAPRTAPPCITASGAPCMFHPHPPHHVSQP
jgi:hypothetical protein